MPKLVFTQKEIDGYLKDHEESRHKYYKECCDRAESIAVHADGKFPEKLIQERRPNEPLMVLEYRKTIWVAKTKPVFSRVFSSLQKIRRSQGWKIAYPDTPFPRINEEETLEKYLEERYPYHTSLTNWCFTVLLRKQLIDPNAVVFVKNIEPAEQLEPTAYVRPYPEIFCSEHIIDFKEDDYAVLEDPAGCVFYVRNQPQTGRSVWVITTQEIIRYDQVNNKLDYLVTERIVHNLGELPVFKLKGVLTDQSEGNTLYESRLAGMIPELDEAVREYSDLQAARVNHIYPERYEYTNNECATCKGKGIRQNPLYTGPGCGCEAQIICDKCDGVGYKVAGPYSKIVVKVGDPLKPGSEIPTPPAGYVEKDVEIVKLQDESVRQHIYDGLAAINFQFLEQTPLNESGRAKEVDKEELDNTVHSIAEDNVGVSDRIRRLTALMRYGQLYSKEEIVDGMLPDTSVPERFNMLDPQLAGKEVTDAKNGKVNPVIINALETDYAAGRFFNEPEVRDRVQLVLELDPLPNVSEDEKMSRLSNSGISRVSYVISSNIQEFVRRAIEEDEEFPEKEITDQREVMVGYAEEFIKQIDEEKKAAMVNVMMDNELTQPDGEEETGNEQPMNENANTMEETVAE